MKKKGKDHEQVKHFSKLANHRPTPRENASPIKDQGKERIAEQPKGKKQEGEKKQRQN